MASVGWNLQMSVRVNTVASGEIDHLLQVCDGQYTGPLQLLHPLHKIHL
jgi:hypothetical protein